MSLRVYCVALAVAFSYIYQPKWPKNALPSRIKDKDEFDFIVVGGGTAGAIVASRLAEFDKWRILLIEAGGDPPEQSIIPGLISDLVRSQYDWDYPGINPNSGGAQKQPHVYRITKGKMLGGSSSINSMIYVRGNPKDYDEWANMGFEGWDWESVLPDFLKSENLQVDCLKNDDVYERYHASEGPIIVTLPRPIDPELDIKHDVILSSMQQIGINTLKDVNGPTQFGISRTLYTQSAPPSVRYSTAQGYLVPMHDRQNLYVLKNAYATKVLIDKVNIAYGVEVFVNNEIMTFFATKEVIVSTGVINTPKLLIASGIGPPEDLHRLGIPKVANLPVGKESQDHFQLPVLVTGAKNMLHKYEDDKCQRTTLNQITLSLQGFYSVNDTIRPELQIVGYYYNQSSPLIGGALRETFTYNDEVVKSILDCNAKSEVFLLNFCLLRPKSRGEVYIPSVLPNVYPKYYTNYLQDPRDLLLTREGIKRIIDHIIHTVYFKTVGAHILKVDLPKCDKFEFRSDAYWDCYITEMVTAQHHQASSCPMGKVVDENLMVYGVKRLRVVDASVMPIITSGNTYAPVMMIAEKASNLIKLDHENIWNWIHSALKDA